MSEDIRACLVCGADLKYFKKTKLMKCAYCNEEYLTNASCINDHYICDNCHSSSAIEHIRNISLITKSKNPLEIAIMMMKNKNVHMHGPENHVLIGSALLTAYHNAGGDIDIEEAFEELKNRANQVPGGVCGLWGSCGAAISSGIFMSVITNSTPLTIESHALSNKMTSFSLSKIAEIGGPRCCKRNGFLSIIEAQKFVKENLSIEMDITDNYKCEFSQNNKQCIKNRCPFYV